MFIPIQTLLVTLLISFLLGMIASFVMLMNILVRVRSK